MGALSNIDIADFRRFLKFQSWKYAGTKGGHEKWCKKGMLRPVIFQTHIDPIPIGIIKNNLRTMGCNAQDFIDYMNK